MNRFVTTVLRDTPGCPNALIKEEVLSSAIEFCRQTSAYAVDIVESVSSGDTEVTLTLPSGFSLVGINYLEVDNVKSYDVSHSCTIIDLGHAASFDYDLTINASLKPLPSFASDPTYKAISLLSGVNMVSLPKTWDSYTAESLLQLIEDQGGDPDSLQKWAGSGWDIYSFGSPFGDFDIVDNTVYAIVVNFATTLTLTMSETGVLPDILYNDWYQTIAAGAKAKLMIMPGKPWTNLKAVGVHADVFDTGVKSAMKKAFIKNLPTEKRISRRMGI